MTESSIAPSAPATPPSFFEDLIDIFFQPAAVFRRRQGRSPWPAILFVAIAAGIIGYLTFNTMLPIIDAEFTRNAAKQMAKNPQITQEMLDKIRDRSESVGKYVAGPVLFLLMLVVGLISWLVGRLVGSKQSFESAFVVVGWAYMPRVLGAVINAVQGLLMDPAKLNSQLSISLSPARFMDPDTANPLIYGLLGRLDLITLWVTVLLAIGLYVTGKVSKERAVVFGILIWLVGSLPALQAGFVAM
jgi:hypothetical protein